MLSLPYDVVTSGVFGHLSLRDLQALNVAFTANAVSAHRTRMLWKSYHYETPVGSVTSIEDMKWLGKAGVNVANLNLRRDGSTDHLSFIATHFPMLKKLDLADKLIDMWEEWLTNKVFVQFVRSCSMLEFLCISPGADIADSGMLALAKSCPRLHTVIFHESCKITDRSIQSLCDHCPNLRHIELFRSEKITDASLHVIAKVYPHLQNINIRGCCDSNEGVMSLARGCHELHSVELGETDCDLNSGLVELWAANPSLHEFNINCYSFITTTEVKQLARLCPQLRRLWFDWCDSVTDDALLAVAELCPQLNFLSVSFCNSVTDAGIVAIAQHCHDLKSIDVSFLRDLSDVGLAALGAGCPLLQEFAAQQTFITDDGVIALARGCKDLRKVDLSLCLYITSVSICGLGHYCPFLSELVLSECPRASSEFLYAMEQYCPNLQVLDMYCDTKLSTSAIRSVLLSCRKLVKIYVGPLYKRTMRKLKSENPFLSCIDKYCEGIPDYGKGYESDIPEEEIEEESENCASEESDENASYDSENEAESEEEQSDDDEEVDDEESEEYASEESDENVNSDSENEAESEEEQSDDNEEDDGCYCADEDEENNYNNDARALIQAQFADLKSQIEKAAELWNSAIEEKTKVEAQNKLLLDENKMLSASLKKALSDLNSNHAKVEQDEPIPASNASCKKAVSKAGVAVNVVSSHHHTARNGDHPVMHDNQRHRLQYDSDSSSSEDDYAITLLHDMLVRSRQEEMDRVNELQRQNHMLEDAIVTLLSKKKKRKNHDDRPYY